MIKRQLAFISDIHSNLPALHSVLDDIKNREIPFSDVYCLGDLVGYGTRPNEVIELIRTSGIQSILGNYDEAVGFYLPTCGCNIDSHVDRMRSKNSLSWTADHTSDTNKDFLRSLDEEIVLDLDDFQILLTHGSPLSINDYVYENDTEKLQEVAEEFDSHMIVFGHTHFPYFKKLHGKLFLNAGSVGRPKDGDNRACYSLVTLAPDGIDVEFIRVSYDVQSFADEVYASGLLDVFGDILIAGKDIK